jgi:hypothetical protein
MRIKRKVKKDQVELLLQPTKVQRIISFDSDIFANIEDLRASREPNPTFSEIVNELLRQVLHVGKVSEKEEEK